MAKSAIQNTFPFQTLFPPTGDILWDFIPPHKSPIRAIKTHVPRSVAVFSPITIAFYGDMTPPLNNVKVDDMTRAQLENKLEELRVKLERLQADQQDAPATFYTDYIEPVEREFSETEARLEAIEAALESE